MKGLTPIMSVGVRLDGSIFTILQYEPVNRRIKHSPDEVFSHTVSAIDALLIVKIVAGAAGSYFGDQLRGTFDITVIADSRLATMRMQYIQEGIGLRLIAHVQPDAGIVAATHARRPNSVAAQPCD